MSTPVGEIDQAKTNTLEAITRLTGLGRMAFRGMRREGLRVKYVGGHAFIKGEWFIDYVEQNGKDSK